ncbi:MAG: PBP1A family penicillin-binding protein, partial [Actinobacteria bacterium]|nr:PBP1A family penicillin-binding protein [Actinomycetota bacterium]
MQALLRCIKTAVIAGAFLAIGLVILIPQARAFTGSWSTSKADGLGDMAELSERSVVQRRDGSTLAVLHADENRAPVKLRQVPKAVIDAVIGVEDDRFWKHHGVDVRGSFRALATNVQSGEVRQGGSTITQQLVKNALLTPEKTVDRKVREALLAWRLEDQLSKNAILERYLNTVYFGNGAYGVQAAAEVYFGKTASQLNEADAVLLAGIIRNPFNYDPIKFPARAADRRRVVVGRLVSADVFSKATGDKVLATPLPTQVESLEQETNDYFVEEVKQKLLKDRRLGETAQERYNAVFKGGLRIVTTLDPDVSQAAQKAVDEILPDTKGKFTAALASVEPSTGAVRAIVGGKDFASVKFNLATQGHRQPGSSFKAMVLVAAIEQGYGPSTVINGSSPCKVEFEGHQPYELENFEGEGGGVAPLTTQTAHSVNCAYVRLAAATGLKNVEKAAKDLGITTDLKVPDCDCITPAIAVGGLTVGVSPLEMASSYATLAADGVYHKPYFIEKVLDRNGKVLFRGGSKGEHRISAQTARTAISILRGVVTGGTGVRANPGKWPVFGKTGTAQEYKDAWFVGSTRQLAAAVWMGNAEAEVSMFRVGSVGRVTGGSYPARIFGQFMRDAMNGRPALAFPAPDPKQLGNKQISNQGSLRPAEGGGPTTSGTVLIGPGG